MESDKSSKPEISPILKLPNEMLEKVLQLLPFRDLLACREVNKKWKSVATDPLRKRCAPLDFSRYDIPKSQRSRAIQTFTQLIRAADEQGDLGEFPVTEFELVLTSDCYWIEMDGSTLIAQFLKAASPLVRHALFHLSEKSIQVSNPCLAIPQDLTFPNLTEITLLVFEHQNKDNKSYSFIKRFIEKCPNIKEFHLHLYKTRRSGAIRRCIVETGIEQKASLVTTLFIDAPGNERDFECLSKFGFKLKNFRLDLMDHKVSPEIFKEFLKGQSATLTSLTVCSGHRNHFRDIHCLPHLKDLSILDLDDYSLAKRGKEKFPTLFYKEQLPALKKMDLTFSKLAPGYFMASHMSPSESLRELILPGADMKDAGGVIRQAARLFPNLKKLQVSHATAGPYMSDIYEALPGIEELCISTEGRKSVDDIITGLPELVFLEMEFMTEEIPLLRDTSYEMSKAFSMLERGTTKTLACLEYLKTLVIYRDGDDSWNVVGGADFTELSGVVLKQMKGLQRINFGVRKYGPIVSATLKEDLETLGIKLIYQRPPYARSRTDFVESDD